MKEIEMGGSLVHFLHSVSGRNSEISTDNGDMRRLQTHTHTHTASPEWKIKTQCQAWVYFEASD